MVDVAWILALDGLLLAAYAYFWLDDAKAWVIRRWGGRLSAYLFLKARNLRKQRVSLLLQQRVLLSEKRKGLSSLVEVPDASSESSDASKQPKGSNPIPSVHNVVPFKRVR